MKVRIYFFFLLLFLLFSGTGFRSDAENLELKIMMTDMRLPDFPKAVPPGELRVVKEFENHTGINLNLEIIPHEEYPRKMRLVMASGDLPDLFNTYGLYDPNFPEVIRSGIAVPLDDYLQEHGPNLLAAIPGEVWDSVRVDGNIYGVPEVLLPSPTRRGVYIRKDWLDALGVETPRTVEEFINVLRLFRDMPSEEEIIPYTGREHLNWMETFFGAYGLLPWGWDYRDGEFAPDIIQPEAKEALGVLRLMYQEGLLDREFLVNSGYMWEEKIVSGRVGMWEHIGSWLSTWQRRVEENNPGAEVAIIPAPVGPCGHRGTGKYPPFLRVWFVTNTAADPSVAVRFFNWLVTVEGQRLVKYGYEDETYVWENEAIVWEPKNDPEHTWRSVLFCMINDGKMDWEYEIHKDPVNGVRFMEADKILAREGIPNPGYDFPVPKTLMERSELPVPHGSLYRRYIYKIILGMEPLEIHDRFVAEWLAAGGEKAIAEATEWYEKNRLIVENDEDPFADPPVQEEPLF